MKRVAIVGVGPTGIYTFYELVKRGEPLAITLFEKEAQAGVGMPYSDDNTAAQMLANIASIEIPPYRPDLSAMAAAAQRRLAGGARPRAAHAA